MFLLVYFPVTLRVGLISSCFLTEMFKRRQFVIVRVWRTQALEPLSGLGVTPEVARRHLSPRAVVGGLSKGWNLPTGLYDAYRL